MLARCDVIDLKHFKLPGSELRNVNDSYLMTLKLKEYKDNLHVLLWPTTHTTVV